MKLDFALIDVERMEIQALDGMKEVITRSPDMIIVCEWTNQPVQITPEEFNRRSKILLKWFYERKYVFYNTIPKGECNEAYFEPLTEEGMYEFSQAIRKRRYEQDVIIAPGHINPNDFH